MARKPRKTRLKQPKKDFNLPDWKLHFLKTGEGPTREEVPSPFEELHFCWGPEAALTFLKNPRQLPAWQLSVCGAEN